MGKRGPAPKSPEDKALEGNPGKRKIERAVDEDDLSSGSLRMPTRMTEEERRVWTDTLAAFPSWYFTLADKYLLIAYCRTVARVEKSEKALQNTAAVITRANGSKCLNPHVALANAGVVQIKMLAEALGLTRRTRRGAIPPSPSDPTPDTQDRAGQEFQDGLLAPPIFGPSG